MASDHSRSAAAARPDSEMAIRALPFGGYVVYAAGAPGSFCDFLAAFGDRGHALAFIDQRLQHNPSQDDQSVSLTDVPRPKGWSSGIERDEAGPAFVFSGEKIGPETKAALERAGHEWPTCD